MQNTTYHKIIIQSAYADKRLFAKNVDANIEELGTNLYEVITKIAIPEWLEAFHSLKIQDCTDYIHNLSLDPTIYTYIRPKSVVNDGLAKLFPNIHFEESDSELDHAGDVDYIGRVGEKAFGIQIKPSTAKSNFGNYSISERMNASFQDFEADYGGKVFVIFSLDGEIANKEIIASIENEIIRLKIIDDDYLRLIKFPTIS